MQNIIINGANYNDVPHIIIPKQGGGDSLWADTSGVDALAADVKSGKKIVDANGAELTGTYLWDWKSIQPELWQNDYYHTSFTLGSTNFATWTPSKTASAIKSASNVGTFTADLTTYEYIFRWRNQFDAAYNTGAILTNQVYREVSDLWQCVFRRPNTNANVTAANFNYTVCITIYNTPLTMYYNASSVLTPYFSVAYGIYAGATATGISSTSSNTPTITVKTPSWNARCSDTYMTTTRATELDQTNSIIKMRCDIYRVPVGSIMRVLFGGLIDLYNNPLT